MGMLHNGSQVIAGIILLVTALALRSATVNRHIRSKLLISCTLFAAYVVATAVSAYAPVSPDLRRQIGILDPLLLAFGIINVIVILAINPWRVDRIPERFPNIVQDALIIALFAVTATLFLRERVLATTAVGAVILGLALQDTLGNLFAGLENPDPGWDLRDRAQQRACARHDHQLLRADARNAHRYRGRRQLRHAAERGQDGDPRCPP
jgi:small-conductance mechanosensitive channel